MINKSTHFAQFLWEEFGHTDQVELNSVPDLISAAIGLGAHKVGDWSRNELELASSVRSLPSGQIQRIRKEVNGGRDPLGEALCNLRSPEERRGLGATFTPLPIVEAMVSWARTLNVNPDRVIEPGTGSGRFLLAAAKAFPGAQLLGIELDPVAAMIARANLAVRGYEKRSHIVLSDYRVAPIPPISGRTLFLGNPPYVRHHKLGKGGKEMAFGKRGKAWS